MTDSPYIIQSQSIVTMSSSIAKPYGLVEGGAIIIAGGNIKWIGKSNRIPPAYRDLPIKDFGKKLITPALIDCHTHVVYGGNRAREFEMRLQGASYQELAEAGGGINSTVEATRKINEENLLEDSLVRVDSMIAEGCSLIEIKSGYGLDEITELKMLSVARQIEQVRPIRVKTTFLGAHAVPPEFNGLPDQYIDNVCIPTLYKAHADGLVDSVDGFCEGIAFQPHQIARVFDAAKELGIPTKLHAEQLSNLGGTKLAASYGALSADHIEYLDEEGVIAMAGANTSAVILPGAYYTLRETQLPPIDDLRKHGVTMAVATDCNPGSSPISSLLLSMNMACTLFRMTPEEALAGTTKNAAKALGLNDTGTIEVGKRADLAIWNIQHPAELSYRVGFNSLCKRVFGGKFG